MDEKEEVLRQLTEAMKRMTSSVKDLTRSIDDTRELLEHIVDKSTRK